MYLNNSDCTYHVIDIEGDPIPSTVVWCAVVQTIEPGGAIREAELYRPEDMEKLYRFIESERVKPDTYFVGHNILGYDFPTLNRIVGTGIHPYRCIDTLVLSYLYSPHMSGGHSLRAWGERFEFPKIEFDDFSQFSEEQLTYCKQDVALTVRLFTALARRMKNVGFSELSCELEHKIRHIINNMENRGVSFDERGAGLLLAELETRKAELEARIQEVFPPELVVVGQYAYRTKKDGSDTHHFKRHVATYPKITFNNSRTQYRVWDYKVFNLASSLQRRDKLLSVGWTPTQLTKAGNPSVTEDSIDAFMAANADAPEEVTLIPEWVVVNNRCMSLREWLGQTDDDGRIHGRIFTCGANTRRMRHQNPNTANICGVDKPFGPELRSFWRAAKGFKQVGVDAKGLEGRVLMHYLDNPEAEAYLTSDFHTANAIAIYHALGDHDIAELVERWRDAGKPKHFEGDPSQYRQIVKALFYAFLYGAGNKKLGRMANGPGKKVREALVANVPGLKRLVTAIQDEQGRTKAGFLRTIDGGFVRCGSSHAALNYICQSAGAILMKQARILLEDKMDHTKAFQILDVHDEWQFEVREDYVEEFIKLACQSITDAGVKLGFNVKMEGEAKVGENWKDCH